MFSYTFPYLLDEDPPSLKFHELRTGFREAGIDLTKFRSYEKLQELRHIANCIKHADDGKQSCKVLRTLRPDFFREPNYDPSDPLETLETSKKPTPVRQPLGGEDLYLSKDEFELYVSAMQDFWDQLADVLLSERQEGS